MKKTQNYQLPQWEATDPVRREDFNAAFAEMDAGLETKAEQAALEQLSAAVTEARTMAGAAQAAADAAWSADNLPFVFGSYKGNGSEEVSTRTVTVGFAPRMIFVTNAFNCYLAVPGQSSLYRAKLAWNSDGFTLTHADPEYRLDSNFYTDYYCVFR